MSGGFNNTIDAKGRLSFPIRLRDGFEGSALIITRGVDDCLWLYPPNVWEEFSARLNAASPMLKNVRKMQRHFLGWSTREEIDNSGRLPIPQSLRSYAHLEKDCVVMGLGKRIEVWDAARYEQYMEGVGSCEESLADVAEQFGDMF
jgi:MraZ protein